MQNDQDGSRQQSVKEGGNVVQVQSQKGSAGSLKVWALLRDGVVIRSWSLRTLSQKYTGWKRKKKKSAGKEPGSGRCENAVATAAARQRGASAAVRMAGLGACHTEASETIGFSRFCRVCESLRVPPEIRVPLMGS